MKIVKRYRTTGPNSMMVPVIAQNQTGQTVLADRSAKSTQITTEEQIVIDPSRRCQKIVGFGASFTDSSAYLVGERVTDSDRSRIMRALFSPTTGAGFSVVRQPMGACDYSRDFYSYDDVPLGSDDPSLTHFSIAHDQKDILPLLRQARDLNPDLFVVGSPWSAPAWMKDSGSFKQGHLLPHYQRAYANYFVRFIQDYQANGIEVNAITPQNEPLYEPPNYSGMGMPAADEARFVHEFLRPAFVQSDVHTQIWGYDHNWDHPEYAEELLERAENDFDGIAWHWYAGDPSVQSQVSRRFPNIPVYFTE
jgi:glucosylceramidase